MLSANRGFVALGHQRDGRGAAYIACTEGWFGTVYWIVTPSWCFLPDPGFHRKVAELNDAAIRAGR